MAVLSFKSIYISIVRGRLSSTDGDPLLATLASNKNRSGAPKSRRRLGGTCDGPKGELVNLWHEPSNSLSPLQNGCRLLDYMKAGVEINPEAFCVSNRTCHTSIFKGRRMKLSWPWLYLPLFVLPWPVYSWISPNPWPLYPITPEIP